VYRYTTSKQSGGECVQVHYEQIVGRRVRRVCTGTLRANSLEACEASVYRYTMSKQSGDA